MTKNTHKEVIASTIRHMDWEINEAKERLSRIAKNMVDKANNATQSCDLMLAGQPHHHAWVEFAGGIVNEAIAAKANLENLVEKRRMLQIINETADNS